MVNEASSLSKLRRSEEFIKDKLSVQNIEDKTYLVDRPLFQFSSKASSIIVLS